MSTNSDIVKQPDNCVDGKKGVQEGGFGLTNRDLNSRPLYRMCSASTLQDFSLILVEPITHTVNFSKSA